MMTKTNYIVIAAILKEARVQYESHEAHDVIDAVTNMLSGAFATDNPNFNIDRFREASGYKPMVWN